VDLRCGLAVAAQHRERGRENYVGDLGWAADSCGAACWAVEAETTAAHDVAVQHHGRPRPFPFPIRSLPVAPSPSSPRPGARRPPSTLRQLGSSLARPEGPRAATLVVASPLARFLLLGFEFARGRGLVVDGSPPRARVVPPLEIQIWQLRRLQICNDAAAACFGRNRLRSFAAQARRPAIRQRPTAHAPILIRVSCSPPPHSMIRWSLPSPAAWVWLPPPRTQLGSLFWDHQSRWLSLTAAVCGPPAL